jgi:hypothetical protein
MPVVRNRRYWMRLVRLSVATIFFTTVIVLLALGAVPMWFLLHPACARTNTPASVGFTYQDVSIPNREGGTWQGYFIPAQNPADSTEKQALIIVPPAFNGDAGAMLHEAKLLVQGGFPVLMFESVVCARGGVHSLGALEAAQIEDAMAYVQQNSDALNVDVDRIGLHGYSSAGASSIFAAARMPTIKAVLAEGNYYDLDSYLNVGRGGNFFESVSVFAMRLTYRISTGQDPAVLTPINAIAAIPPRAVFLIYGSLEAERGGARKLLAAAEANMPDTAHFPKLWIVPNVEHGGYIYGAGGEAEFARYAVSFYQCALMDACTVWTEMWEAQR